MLENKKGCKKNLQPFDFEAPKNRLFSNQVQTDLNKLSSIFSMLDKYDIKQPT
jgi:hypothetical protein